MLITLQAEPLPRGRQARRCALQIALTIPIRLIDVTAPEPHGGAKPTPEPTCAEGWSTHLASYESPRHGG